MDPEQNPLLGCNKNYIKIKDENTHYPAVSSDPTRVCICINFVPECNITDYRPELFPGQLLKITVVAVGFRFGTVPSVVQAEYDHSDYSWRKIGGGQYLQTSRQQVH